LSKKLGHPVFRQTDAAKALMIRRLKVNCASHAREGRLDFCFTSNENDANLALPGTSIIGTVSMARFGADTVYLVEQLL
jgi:hypothetical protein